MKILYKDGVKTICRDDHPEPEGFDVIHIPSNYNITTEVDGEEIVKDIEVIRSELNINAL
jgi:hypothetical protein